MRAGSDAHLPGAPRQDRAWRDTSWLRPASTPARRLHRVRICDQPTLSWELLRVLALHVLFDELLNLFRDMLALERHGLLAIDIHRGHRPLASTRQADANVGMLTLAWAGDDTTHHRDSHVLHARMTLAPFRHALTDVTLDLLRQFLEIRAGCTSAAGTRDDHRHECAQAHGLQNLLRDDDFIGA